MAACGPGMCRWERDGAHLFQYVCTQCRRTHVCGTLSCRYAVNDGTQTICTLTGSVIVNMGRSQATPDAARGTRVVTKRVRHATTREERSALYETASGIIDTILCHPARAELNRKKRQRVDDGARQDMEKYIRLCLQEGYEVSLYELFILYVHQRIKQRHRTTLIPHEADRRQLCMIFANQVMDLWDKVSQTRRFQERRPTGTRAFKCFVLGALYSAIDGLNDVDGTVLIEQNIPLAAYMPEQRDLDHLGATRHDVTRGRTAIQEYLGSGIATTTPPPPDDEGPPHKRQRIV